MSNKVGLEGPPLPPANLDIQRTFAAYSARKGTTSAMVEQSQGGAISMGTGRVQAVETPSPLRVELDKPGIGLDSRTLGEKKTIGITVDVKV